MSTPLSALRRHLGRCLLGSLLVAASLPPSAAAEPPARPGWRLVWSDEFDTPGQPDATKWGYERGFVRNGEKQYYTPARLENARVEDGHLVIEARKESFQGADYTSASLTTRGKASWTRGRIEVRAKLPRGRGMWPAIWTLGVDEKHVRWPACGEIDILENVGFEPRTIHANVHTGKFNHTRGTGRGKSLEVPAPAEAFHVYALEWFADRLDFFFDDQKYFTCPNDGGGVDSWPFETPQYLILNIAVGGAWGGQHGIDDSIFPQRMEIDYVRVYETVP